MDTNTPITEPRATIYESPPPEKQFFSLGHLAQFFQRPVEELRCLLAAAGKSPAYLQNDIPYYDGLAFLAVGRAIRESA
jgi:hypothetical protein